MNRWEQQRQEQRERAQEPCNVDGCKYCVEIDAAMWPAIERFEILAAKSKQKPIELPATQRGRAQ